MKDKDLLKLLEDWLCNWYADNDADWLVEQILLLRSDVQDCIDGVYLIGEDQYEIRS